MENKINKSKVLLLGGVGFIGHHLALRLVEEGHEVVVADGFKINSILNFYVDEKNREHSVYNDFLLERVKLLKEAGVEIKICDCDSRIEVTKLIAEGFDVVYLLAAISHASTSNQEPILAFDNGVLPLLNVISALSGDTNTRLVYMSSSTVYGDFLKEEVDENDVCNPYGVYATIKYAGELILKSVENSVNFAVARPSALYGERCVSRRVSQVFLEDAFVGKDLVFSGNPEEKLDFTYIQDLITGLILLGFKKEAAGQIFNLTFGDAQKILKLPEILSEYFSNVKVKQIPRNQATPIRGTLSNKKAQKILGFKPQWSLEKGYRRYIDWYINRAKTKEMIFSNISQQNK